MNSEHDLIQKLMISKKIMDKHREIPRNTNQSDITSFSSPQVESFAAPQASFNIPQEILMETKNLEAPKYENTRDKILSSKLPNEIKQLMIEHPISQPNNMSGPTLSSELVEKASRLMGTNGQQSHTPQQTQQQVQKQNIFNDKELRKMLREVVEEVLSENGLLVESISKTNDSFSFRVGKHIFEGKVTKIKKVS